MDKFFDAPEPKKKTEEDTTSAAHEEEHDEEEDEDVSINTHCAFFAINYYTLYFLYDTVLYAQKSICKNIYCVTLNII